MLALVGIALLGGLIRLAGQQPIPVPIPIKKRKG